MTPLLLCSRLDPGLRPAEGDFQTSLQHVGLVDAVTGAPPLQSTRVSCSWDKTHWRVFFECIDARPWATLTKFDDPLFQEETVEIFFDPVGDLQAYYEIEVNPNNAVLDLFFRKSRSGFKGDKEWNCEGLQTSVTRTPAGWNTELAIPFASVATHSPNPSDRWRVNFCRIDRPLGPGPERELTAWSAPLRANFHTPERFGFVEFA